MNPIAGIIVALSALLIVWVTRRVTKLRLERTIKLLNEVNAEDKVRIIELNRETDAARGAKNVAKARAEELNERLNRFIEMARGEIPIPVTEVQATSVEASTGLEFKYPDFKAIYELAMKIKQAGHDGEDEAWADGIILVCQANKDTYWEESYWKES